MAEYGEPLTRREKELLRLVATGITNQQVAHRLHISVNTVKVHLRNIYTKLGAESRTEATMIAVREGLIVVDGIEPAAETATDEAAVPAPEPPLPLFQRVALVAAALLVVAGMVLTWPRSRPQAENGPDLPLEQVRDGTPTTWSSSAESSWHERAQMPTRRAYLALAVADDRFFAIGGQTPEGPTAAVEIYSPEEDLWGRGADLPTPATYIAAATIGDRIFVPGGCDGQGTPSRTLAVYEVAADAWEEAAPLPEPRCAYALTAFAGRLYLFGGWDGERYVATVYVYDPETDAWTTAPPMSTARGFAAAAPLGERIYVVGGYDGHRELTTCAVYDPSTTAWDACAPLTVERGGLGLVPLGGQLYAIGGGGWTSYLGFNERYDPGNDTWRTIATPLTGEWRSPGVIVFEDTIYAIGGWNGDYLSMNQSYEPLPFHIFIPVSN